MEIEIWERDRASGESNEKVEREHSPWREERREGKRELKKEGRNGEEIVSSSQLCLPSPMQLWETEMA